MNILSLSAITVALISTTTAFAYPKVGETFVYNSVATGSAGVSSSKIVGKTVGIDSIKNTISYEQTTTDDTGTTRSLEQENLSDVLEYIDAANSAEDCSNKANRIFASDDDTDYNYSLIVKSTLIDYEINGKTIKACKKEVNEEGVNMVYILADVPLGIIQSKVTIEGMGSVEFTLESYTE